MWIDEAEDDWLILFHTGDTDSTGERSKTVIDGDLRKLFKERIKKASWTPIETGSVIGGVPDAFFAFEGGNTGWIEYKRCVGNCIKVRALQVAWIKKHRAIGVKVFVAVRKRDELHLFSGEAIRELKMQGISGGEPFLLGSWSGGPGQWDWEAIASILRA